MSKRKKYPKEFKLDAVSLVVEQSYSRAAAAKSLGINANMMGRWIKEAESEDGQNFRGNDKLTEEQEQIRALLKRVKRLEMEKDILKMDHLPDDVLPKHLGHCSSFAYQSVLYTTIPGHCLRGTAYSMTIDS